MASAITAQVTKKDSDSEDSEPDTKVEFEKRILNNYQVKDVIDEESVEHSIISHQEMSHLE